MGEIIAAAAWNLKAVRRNPRMLLCMAMGFLLCFVLTQKTIAISIDFSRQIQVFEPFVWCFSDSDGVLFSSLALFLILSGIPRMDEASGQILFRIGRTKWVIGQMLFAAAVSLVYTAFLLLCSICLCLSNAYWGNCWSDTAMLLSFAPEGFQVALSVVRKTIKLTTPYACAGSIFWLLTLYMMFLTMLKLAVTLRYGARAGIGAVMGISFCSYMLSPNRFIAWLQLEEQLYYYANLLSAWLSPLQHATYIMHNFGYDRLPTLQVSFYLLGGMTLALAVCSVVLAKRFTGGKTDE